ncbi:MAG: penicillin acylase family protein [Chitinophagales bacterium]|nr:penicillin acylase family protein [Chitinophagales bacterium]
MKIIRLLFFAALTFLWVYALNKPWHLSNKDVPAIAPLLSPFSGFWKNAPVHYQNESLKLQGIQEDVSIVYDQRQVPHIFAQNISDVLFAQGYVTAKDRLWQMDFTTRATAGRISEIIGEKALQFDLGKRRAGLLASAETIAESWRKDIKQFPLLKAYCEGINAYIHQLSPADYPIEYKLMGFSPEEWTPLKTALYYVAMVETLATNSNDIAATHARQVFGGQVYDFLYPPYNPQDIPIIPDQEIWQEFTNLKDTLPLLQSVPIDSVKVTPSPPTQVGVFPDETAIGSNNWAVTATKTAQGYAILCNDPHLQLSLPSIWYEIQLHIPQANVYGVSLPGVPGVVIGFNDNIAWGLTNTEWDVADYYQITWKDDWKNEYLLDGMYREVNKRAEKIVVKNGETVYDTIRYTVWGPVMKESNERDAKVTNIAEHWLAFDVPQTNELTAFLQVNMAKNFAEFSKALENHAIPAQNFAYADVSGNVGMVVQGKVPISSLSHSRFVQRGDSSKNQWKEYIAPRRMPKVYNPDSNYVVSANQRTTSERYPYALSGNYASYRGNYLNRQLNANDSIDIDFMQHLQNSTYSIKAEAALPLLLQNLQQNHLGNEAQIYVELLQAWKYDFDANKAAPVLFDQWYQLFYEKTWDEMYRLQDSIAIEMPKSWRTTALLAENPENFFFDNTATPQRETAADIVTEAFLEMVSRIEKWKSENNNQFPTLATFRNKTIPHLAQLAPFSSKMLETGGDASCVNAYTGTTGPSWRMVVSLEKPVKAWGVFPGGASGNPGSAFYDNGVAAWDKGNYFELLFLDNPQPNPETVSHTLILSK